jgi:hypothetical protein
MPPEKPQDRRRRTQALSRRLAVLVRRPGLWPRVWGETKAVLGTAGCAALITVAVGGIVGNSILVCAQRIGKAEELAELRRNKATELALQAENQCAKDRFAKVIEVFGLVFEASTSGEKYLARLEGLRLRPGRSEAVRAAEAGREEFKAEYERWLKGKESADLSLGFYFPQSRELQQAWDEADLGVEVFLRCVSHLQPVASELKPRACEKEFSEVHRKLSLFNGVLERSWRQPCPVPELPSTQGPEADAEDSASIVSCLRESLGLR